jgi:N-acetylmuramoyl-L-alanine amidase
VRAGLALLLVPALLRADSAAEATRAPAPAIAAARHDAAATAVARALAAAPNPGGAVQLRASSLVGERLTLDFSREALDLAPGSLAFEQFSRVVHRAAAEELRGDFAHFEIQTLIEGVPLDRLLAVSDRPAPPRAPALLPPATPPVARSLATRRIAVSPGHGYYQNAAGAWVLQRGYWQGIVEDFLNHDMITLVRDELAAAGADVHPARNLDRAAGPGESGFPKWQEAARYHVKALGADASVWNEPGYDHLSQDIRCRPRWANAIGADILVSLHNNGGGGTGTETLYDTNNGFGPESRRLADAVHNRVIAAIRRDYQPAWTDRRVQGFNGNYGENRLATRPSILIEVAFMDRPTPDNAALQDEAFKRLVARAIREGIQEYFDGPAALPPAAPSTLLASAAPGGGVTLTWRDLSNNETGFRLERRTVGAGHSGRRMGSARHDRRQPHHLRRHLRRRRHGLRVPRRGRERGRHQRAVLQRGHRARRTRRGAARTRPPHPLARQRLAAHDARRRPGCDRRLRRRRWHP